MEFIQIPVTERESLGSAPSNRLRRGGHVPAVLYGMDRRNISLAIPQADLDRFLRTGSHLVELKLGDKTRPAILRDMQVDSVTDEVLHADFQRVDHDAEVETEVPVHFKGRAKGEAHGGAFTILRDTVQVKARPADLPRGYTVEIDEVDIGDNITLDDLEQRPGVTFLEDEGLLLGHCTELESLEDRLETELVEDEEPALVGEEGAEGEAEGEGEAAEGEAEEGAEPSRES